MSSKVRLVLTPENSKDGVDIPLGRSGAFLVLVASEEPNGASATFSISGSLSKTGSILRNTTTIGKYAEQLSIVWHKGQHPRLKFMCKPTTKGKKYWLFERDMDGNERSKGEMQETIELTDYAFAYHVTWISAKDGSLVCV